MQLLQQSLQMHSLNLLEMLIAQVKTGAITPPRMSMLPAAPVAAAAAMAPPRAPPAAASAAASIKKSRAPPNPPPQMPSSPPQQSRFDFVDIGANLLDSMFDGEYRGKRCHQPDIDAVLARAADAGVVRLIVTAGSLEESRAALDFIRTHRSRGSPVELFATCGVHPTRSLEFLPPDERAQVEAAMKALADAETVAGKDVADAAAAASVSTSAAALAELEEAVLSRPHVTAAAEAHLAALRVIVEQGRDEGIVVAVGECGLDYDRLFFCPRGVQRAAFARQLGLAASIGLPLFLHNRATGGDFGEMCTAHTAALAASAGSGTGTGTSTSGTGTGRGEVAFNGVVHSFDGDAPELSELLGLGLHIGLNGCSLRTAGNLDVACQVPLEALHLETDAPWCGIKKSHAGHKHTRPLLSTASGQTYPDLKKEKWEAGATVKDRSEPCHIVHVLQVLCGARNERGLGEAGAKDQAEEAKVAEAAYVNSMRMFWPHA